MNQAIDSQEDENKKGENKRETFKQTFKRKLFQIYFELMRERNIDFILAAVMMVISFIQIYGLLYNTKINFPFKDDLYSTICTLCDLIRIYPMLESAGDAVYYWIVAYVLIFVLVTYIIQLIYIDYSIKIEKFYFIFPIKIMRYFSSIIFWVLMMPIIEIFISIFSCENGLHVVDESVECWSGLHIFYCILFSLSLIGYVVVFMLISFFYNESRPYHTDALARLDTNFETYMTLYKILIAIVGHFLYQDNLHWLIIVIHIGGSINFCKMYLKYLPYYNQRTSVLFGSCWLSYLWISLNILLTKALESVDYQGQTIVIIVGLILIYPATKQIRDSKIQKKIFNKKHDKIKSEYELDIFIHKLYRLIIDQHVNEVDEMILLGIVHNHQSECLNNECPLNNIEELYLPLTDSMSDRRAMFSKDPILLYHLINSIYAEYAKSSNSTAVLHTTYAYFLFYQIGNIHTALLELNVAEKCDTNYQQKFTVYRAKRFIENYLSNKFGKNKDMNGKQTFAELDVTIVITFESLYAKLNKEIEKSANDHIEFWSHLDSQMVDLNVLHKLGLNIINNTKRINEIWHQLTRINPNYPKALQIYGNYLVQIKNDTQEGEDFLNQASAMGRPRSLDEHVNDFELMFAEDTAIVVISGNKDSQAKIMKTNNGITKLFGYNTFEVHGHEVNILMPPIIGVKHNYFLEQFFKTGKERVINNDLSTFAMLRVGHIFSITLIVKPVPSLKNDIQYIGLIKPTNKDYDFILTDQYGRIDSISKGITSMLQLQATFFKENEIFIQVLCPQLCETEKIKGSKEHATRFELWQGVKDLTFIVPRNFSNLSQKSGSRGGAMAMANINNQSGINHNNHNDDDDGQHHHGNGASGNRRGEPSFVGLKSPDHLKKVCNMFRNNDFKTQPHKYLTTLKNNINYDNPEVYRGPVKTEIINRSHGNGYLQLKVYKILNPKRAGTTGDSDSARGVVNAYANKNVRVMIDEAMRKMEDMTSDDLEKRINQMKVALESLKKGLRHPSAKQKPSNISTPNVYEEAEIQKYAKEIRGLDDKLRIMRQREEQKRLEDEAIEDKAGGAASDSETGSNVGFGIQAKKSGNNNTGASGFGGGGKASFFGQQNSNNTAVEENNFLLNESANLDYERIKNLYPLRENASAAGNSHRNGLNNGNIPPGMENMNVHDLSAVLNDDSMLQEKNLLDQSNNNGDYSGTHLNSRQQNRVFINQNDAYGHDNDLDGYGGKNPREDDERLDLLKDIRKKQIDQQKKKKKDNSGGNGGEGKQEGDDDKDAAGGTGTTAGDSTGDGSGGEDAEDEKFLEEDTGSVASSTKSLMKHLRMLRNALYENYSPPSIRNLKFYVKIVFLALLIITIVWYIQSKNIYKQLKDNIENIHSSKNRMNSLTDIGADVRVLSFINQGRVNKNRGNRDYEQFKRNDLVKSSTYIQQAQNLLSNTYLRDVFKSENNEKINPKDLQLIYNTPCAMPMFYYVDSWSAIMGVAVHALTIKDMPLKDITLNDTSVFFIIQNSLNNILEAISDSTQAILDETENISDKVDFTLQILLYVASGSLFMSICLIFPVATKVDKNKDELLRHFMLIDRDDVKRQLEKCRIFFNTMHDKEHVTQQNMGDIDDDEFKDEDGKDGEGDPNDPSNPNKTKNKQRQRSRKNKMHKKFSTNFISLLVKFLIVLTVLEGYFLLCYLRSIAFLSIINNLIQESGTITLRQFSNNFLYQIMQEVLTTNGVAQVKNINSLTYIFTFLNQTIQEQEQFLKTHSNNAPYHSDQFNSFFDLLIYQNVCDAVYQGSSSQSTDCGTFMGGILKKGLYSANVAYWDNMRSMATDFNNSARDRNSIDNILNSDRLIQNENLKDIYFADSYSMLLNQLDGSIFYNFDNKDKEDTILFAVYIVILFLLYFILWNKFIEATRHSLWVTKSMLAIIPLEIIQKVPKIKDFLLASSKNTLSAFKD